MKKKKKKDKRTQLKRDLDKLVQEIFIKKYPYCLVCGGKTSEMHHFIPKSRSLFLRYKSKNLIPLCKSCHFKHHNGDPDIHIIILQKRGIDWYNKLKKERYKIFKNTLENLRGIEEKLKEEKWKISI